MSRVAKYPVLLPKGVEVHIDRGMLSVKGRNGSLTMAIHADVQVGPFGGHLVLGARSYIGFPVGREFLAIAAQHDRRP